MKSISRLDLLAAGAIIAFTLLAYIPAMGAGLIWDDDYYLLNNLHLSSIDGLRRVWFVLGSTTQYYPMVHTSLWLEYQLWSQGPTGYHVDNIILHALNALLFWRLLRRLGVPGAWLAGAVFALHPVEVESVAWISERKNVLSTFFYLSSMHIYFRYEAPEEDAQQQFGLHWYGLSFLLFLCALWSKTITFSLPAAILLIYWWKRGRIRLSSARPLLPFVVAGGLAGYLTVWMERHLVGASGADWGFTLVERLLIAGRAALFYLGKLIWPATLTFSYPRWEIDAGVVWQYLYPLSAAAILFLAWRLRGRIGRGPLTALLYFGGTLIPALGFFDVFPFFYSFVADHFQYLASLGPIALFAGAATVLMRRIPIAAVQPAVVAALLLTLGFLTWRQSHVYDNLETLWKDVFAKNPASILAHNNLGALYLDQGNYEMAVFHCREVLRLDPEDEIGHFNLANSLRRFGDLRGAKEHYRAQIERDPDFFRAHESLADLLEQEGRYREAAHHYEQALRIRPDEHVLKGRLRQLKRRLSPR